MLTPAAERYKMWVCDRSLTEIAGCPMPGRKEKMSK